MLNKLMTRLRALLRKSEMERELDEELRYHIEQQTEQNIRLGMNPEEAFHAARKAFGGVEQAKERSRDTRGVRWLDDLWQDLRYGARILWKNPGFTIVAALTLAFGIGANTAIFSLLNATLLRTLPVKDPQQLVVFTTVGPQGTDNSYSYRQIERFNQNNHSFTGIIIASGANRMRLTEPGTGAQVEAVQAARVSGNFFSVLGVNAAAGRTLTDADDNASSPQPVAVISYKFWKNRFASDPGVVGRKITLDDFTFTIVGVAPPGFFGFEVGYAPDIWWPLQMTPHVMPGDNRLRRGAEWLRLMARLKPDAQPEQARAEMDAVFQQYISGISPDQAAGFTPAQRRNYFERRIRLDAGATGLVRNHLDRLITQPLLLLMVAVGLVLLIASANVANLLLVRAAVRRKEIAVRLSLGAGRFRLVRQLLTESLLLATLSGALGLLLARWGANLLLAYLPRGGSVTLDPALDMQVFGFTLAVTLLTGALFGLAPALRATRLDLSSALKSSIGKGTGGTRLALHKVLVVAQVALSLFLLIGAGLFVRSLQNLKNLDSGFDRENVVLFGLDTGREYTPARLVTLQHRLLERLASLPGARSASLSDRGLLSGGRTVNNIAVEGYAQRPDEDVKCHQLWVGPKFFMTMGIPLLQGRDFNSHELQPLTRLSDARSANSQASQPPSNNPAPSPANATANTRLAAVINQAMARYFFGAQNPIGRRIRFSEGEIKDIPIEVIGIAKDAKYEDLREQTRRIVYLSYFQWPPERSLEGQQRIMLRTLGNPSNSFSAIQGAVRELDPQIQVQDLQTMSDVVDETLTRERFIAQLGGFFSLCALSLACIGLYGVMSYATTRRTQEIGIRIALGAQSPDVIRLVLHETLWLVTVGIAIGLVAALAATRLVTNLLFGLTPNDPLTIAVAVLVMLTTALLACFVPARRATKVDPIIALRSE
jgi:predicted permease